MQSDLPSEVGRYYEALADRRGWPDATREAFLASVAFIRDLDAEDLPRSHYKYVDDDGSVWLFETVAKDGQRHVIRQIEWADAEVPSRYWWGHLEDEYGFLTTEPLSSDAPVSAISVHEFHGLWERAKEL